MPNLYNQIQGQSLERLAALSDGIFAVAMTLLVLDLHVPSMEAVHSEPQLRAALMALYPQFISYLMSFLTLGIFWAGQQTQFNYLVRGNRDLAWIHIAFLFAISGMPFSTRLLAEFIIYRTALLLYWCNILTLGLILYASWRYANRAGLVKEDVPMEIRRAVRRRILVAQGLYALGASLCLVNTYWSIGFIVLIQLNYAIAPRFGKARL
ncbi:Integral membrane protein [Acidisarcina polymorpha]|uniref:Integral membrane protein n=1 Tax=Acidisarcina polymorpha TaxID=2211140 RepID=A0A2Z5G629_9BACT|nr:TMEM175 family protein [Acidisarcina polymorpha]AXC14440.1 Integral membrane protein [Acidisarcina polymorpha]